MKKLLFILAGIVLTVFTANASNFARGYGNSFIFVEDGIEFAVFPDGQFDFNVDGYGPKFGAQANFSNVSISFNTGYNYNPYVQYDDYGAVVQIENTPIYYDYYGRIAQAGNVYISYNSFGRISRIGGLYVHYNRYNRYSYFTGFINLYNRYYVYRPWHDYYVIPAVNYCVVYNRPYRQYYQTVRHHYYAPYTNNYRSYSRINSRRGAVAHNGRRSDRYIQKNSSGRRNGVKRDNTVRRRNSIATNNTRTGERQKANTVKPRRTVSGKDKSRIKTRPNDQRTRVNKRTDNTKKRLVKSNTVRTTKPRFKAKPRVASTQKRKQTKTVQRAPQRSSKSKGSQRVARTNSSKKTSSRPAQNKRSSAKRRKN